MLESCSLRGEPAHRACNQNWEPSDPDLGRPGPQERPLCSPKPAEGKFPTGEPAGDSQSDGGPGHLSISLHAVRNATAGQQGLSGLLSPRGSRKPRQARSQWLLRNTASDGHRLRRRAAGRAGSVPTEVGVEPDLDTGVVPGNAVESGGRQEQETLVTSLAHGVAHRSALRRRWPAVTAGLRPVLLSGTPWGQTLGCYKKKNAGQTTLTSKLKAAYFQRVFLFTFFPWSHYLAFRSPSKKKKKKAKRIQAAGSCLNIYYSIISIFKKF